jgi:Protein of unknown function (DUF2634).
MDEDIFGIDYSSNGELTSTGDLMLVSGLDNAKQAIINRLSTCTDIYDYLSEYGCDLNEVVGAPTNKSSLSLLELIIKEALKLEPHVQDILNLNCYFDDKAIVAELSLELVDGSVLDLNIEY